jgi:hypothetical protein
VLALNESKTIEEQVEPELTEANGCVDVCVGNTHWEFVALRLRRVQMLANPFSR